MKKIILVVFMLSSIISFSQEAQEQPKQNELTSNLFDLVVAGSFNVNYEHLFTSNQAVAISATIFDTYGYYDAGYIKENSAMTFEASYLVYFSKEKNHSGFFFYPLIKLRTGEITVEDYGYYNSNTDQYVSEEFTYDTGGFSAGFGIGHKWVFDDKFVLGINSDIARNLGGDLDADYLGNVEFKFGVNFGIRF